MATSTYLTIVNDTILEAGNDLAFFASNGSDFATPPTTMHTRFKKWVKDAWRDIQQTAPDWQFSTDRCQVVLRPRIMWTGATAINYSTTLPLVSYDIVPVNDSTVLRTVDVVDAKILSGGPLDGATPEYATGYVDLDGDEADTIDFPLNVGSTKLFYLDPPDSLELIISGWGSYDFSETTQQQTSPPVPASVKQINQSTFRISDYGGTVAEGAKDAKEYPLAYVPWETFLDRDYDIGGNSPGRPYYVTQDFEGRYRFYPALNKDYLVVFDYERGVQYLTAYTDVPFGIPEEFVDVIKWKALQYYGQYDEQPSVSNTQGTGRADRNLKVMLARLEKQTREKFHFKPVKLW